MVAEPGLKVIYPVCRPEGRLPIDTTTSTPALPFTSIEPVLGFVLSHGTFECASQVPLPQPFPFLIVTLWSLKSSDRSMLKLSVYVPVIQGGIGRGGRIVK